MTPLTAEMLKLVSELAAGSALSSAEFFVVATNFPALAAEAAARGLDEPGDAELVAAVADPEEIEGDVFDRLCDRAAALATQLR
jgi:hypothetical protein